MLQTLTYIGIGILGMIGMLLLIGGAVFLLDRYVEPVLESIAEKYPRVTVWIVGIILTGFFIFLFHHLGKILMGDL